MPQTPAPSLADKDPARTETVATVVHPSEAEAASGREKLQQCVSMWKANPALFLAKYPEQALILSLQDVLTDAWGFRLILTVDEALLTPGGKDSPDPMQLTCVWNQPYMSFHAGEVSAPYCFRLSSVDTSKPAIHGRVKTGHSEAPGTGVK